MPSYAYDVDAADPAPVNARAPTRAEIEAMTAVADLRELQFQAEEMEISLRTQLEFFVADAPALRGRRVAALIFWRTALLHIKRRRAEVYKENGRA